MPVVLPVPGVTDGPEWAVTLNNAITDVDTRASVYSRPPVGSYWSPPHLGIGSNKPIASLLNVPLWFPPMGAAVQGFVNVNTTTAGVANDTVTVTFYACTPEFLVDTTVLTTSVLPVGTFLGRTEVALPASFVIPSPLGLWAQITAYTAGSPMRLSSGSSQGMVPGRNYAVGSSGSAIGLLPLDVPVIVFRRSA